MLLSKTSKFLYYNGNISCIDCGEVSSYTVFIGKTKDMEIFMIYDLMHSKYEKELDLVGPQDILLFQ